MSEKPLIWIVDDQPEFLNNLALTLGMFFQVKSFTSSKKLLEELEQENTRVPQLLLSDYRLEEDQLLVDLLDLPQFQFIIKQSQILVLSGNPSQLTINRLLEKGVLDFISKPANVDELVVKINRAIAKSRTRDGHIEYHGHIITNPIKRLLYWNDKCSDELTGREFQILTAILRAGSEGVDKRSLVEQVWSGKAIDPSALSVHLSALRKKIRKANVVISYDRKLDSYRIDGDELISDAS